MSPPDSPLEIIAREISAGVGVDARYSEIAKGVLSALSDAGMVVVPREQAEPVYDFIGAYMWDPHCYRALDHDGQVLLARDIAENTGYELVKISPEMESDGSSPKPPLKGVGIP